MFDMQYNKRNSNAFPVEFLNLFLQKVNLRYYCGSDVNIYIILGHSGVFRTASKLISENA